MPIRHHSIDSEHGLAYFTLSASRVHRTLMLCDDINVDFSEAGEVVGVEFLNLRHPVPGASIGFQYGVSLSDLRAMQSILDSAVIR